MGEWWSLVINLYNYTQSDVNQSTCDRRFLFIANGGREDDSDSSILTVTQTAWAAVIMCLHEVVLYCYTSTTTAQSYITR